MKPGTKLQREICTLSFKHLPDINVLEKKYAAKHCLDHVAFVNKTGTVNCMDCGHSWKTNPPIKCPQWHTDIIKEYVNCPSCKEKLLMKGTQKRTDSDYSNFGIITTCKGYQVIRLFDVDGHMKTKSKKRINYFERGQIWIAPNGKHEVIGHQKNRYGGQFYGDFTLRHRNNAYHYSHKPFVTYPRVRVTKKIERNGFYGDFLKETPYNMFKGLLTCNYTETLLKVGYIELFKHILNDKRRSEDVGKYWSSIRIAIRHGYRIEDASSYMDYLRWLKEFGKDLHSPKYICPRNFKEEHAKYVEKLRIIRRNQEVLDRIQRSKNDKKQFAKDKRAYAKHARRFKDLIFTIPNLTIRPLKNLREIEKAGSILKHCIFGSHYYTNFESLLMVAYEDGDRMVETIEINLNRFSIEQCRGFDNLPTIYNGEIIDEVNDKMDLIRRAFRKKQYKSKKQVA